MTGAGDPGAGRQAVRSLRLACSPGPGETIGELFVLIVSRQGLAEARLAAASQLTHSERAVAALAVQGLSNAEIARLRAVKVRTVAAQLQSVFRKLGVASRIGLVMRLLHESCSW